MQHLFQKITLNYIIHKWHVLILWQIKAQKQFYIKEISIKNSKLKKKLLQFILKIILWIKNAKTKYIKNER